MKNVLAAALCTGFMLAGVQAFADEPIMAPGMTRKQVTKDCMIKLMADDTTKSMTKAEMKTTCRDKWKAYKASTGK